MIYCPNCGAGLSNSEGFCPECGAPVRSVEENTCAYCGTRVDGEQIFCPNCGHRMPQVQKIDPVKQPGKEPEIKLEKKENPSPKQKIKPTVPVPAEPVIRTGGAWFLAVICLFFLWPASVYSMICISKVKKASDTTEAVELLKKSYLVSVIGMVVGLVIALFILAF
ncbi:zinc ribbon domain-containing protein [Clostridium sp. AM58-1XD]|uniref:zinc ribbon domain-containing protein n=1 Tax=Clostridium sp. AM58-1XD TaxID=2292307 RepID=UPI000E46FA7F|nr:zinc ribbon domain-containing protein [Clostridium sp. AM58-1XD]RGY98894.1 zinc-ribbon domain-containing protein [Clostridium sp. AM58-1XD]